MITDLKKYKRLFAFGCSFTSYIYPTWADLIHKSMNSDTEFYNFGKSGSGNVLIANRITEANKKYKFNKDDLVVVMWSTFCRIDYYVTDNGGWHTPGNVYTQGLLNDDIVKTLGDPNGFLMRDFSIIELTNTYLKSLPCDHLKFLSVPLNYNSYQSVAMDTLADSIVEVYSDLKDQHPNSMFEFMGNKWSSKIKYSQYKGSGSLVDYHPSPIDYLNYMLYCKVPLNDDSIQYANESFTKLIQPNLLKKDIIDTFSECDSRISAAYKLLW